MVLGPFSFRRLNPAVQQPILQQTPQASRPLILATLNEELIREDEAEYGPVKPTLKPGRLLQTVVPQLYNDAQPKPIPFEEEDAVHYRLTEERR